MRHGEIKGTFGCFTDCRGDLIKRPGLADVGNRDHKGRLAFRNAYSGHCRGLIQIAGIRTDVDGIKCVGKGLFKAIVKHVANRIGITQAKIGQIGTVAKQGFKNRTFLGIGRNLANFV